MACRGQPTESEPGSFATGHKMLADVDPFKNPRTADETYLDERRREMNALARQIADAEAEIDQRVYRLFELTADEMKLLEKEVEH
jgi:hypothetical protein